MAALTARPRLLLCLLFLLAGCASDDPSGVVAHPSDGSIAEELTRVIERELAHKEIPSLTIALVRGQKVVWSRGFGRRTTDDPTPPRADTPYRVGSVSKLFTDVAMMRLVEEGKVDLDAPVTRYLPDFQPKLGEESGITLRQLMSHRAGLVREPAVGNYFDDSGPDLETTVRSLNASGLVHPPGTRTKYSNAGVAVVGRVLEKVLDRPFARALEERLLHPLGLHGCGFEATPELRERMASATMWTYDGRRFPAPQFALGTAPAGNLYASVSDLATFLRFVFARGEAISGRLLSADSLAQMMQPQVAKERFGLGFALGSLDGLRLAGHSGAVYGYATELSFLPDEELGVAVCSAADCSNPVIRRIARHALRLLLAKKHGRPLPRLEFPTAIPKARALALEGRYRDGGTILALTLRNGRLTLDDGRSLAGLSQVEGDLVADDLLDVSRRFRVEDDALVFGKRRFVRVADERPAPCPARWRGLIGEYGADHNVLYVLERKGALFALIEWFEYDRLQEVAAGHFLFPQNSGMYHGESLRFELDENGRALAARIGGIVFPRREVGTEHGETFKITPLLPAETLRAQARSAAPPTEEGKKSGRLVDVTKVEPGIELDVRYAGTNNFMGMKFYEEERAFLQEHGAFALAAAHRSLAPLGYGLLVYDAYRPWYVTKMFYDATPAAMKGFVADPAKGSRHNRGCAVDLGLYDLASGEPIPMVSGYDEFSERSNPLYPGGTALERWHRDLLRRVMREQGFEVFPLEWWHFDAPGWREYAIRNLSFAEIEKE